MSLTSGTRLGPYEIRSPLGVGGMGEVYRARDTKLDREVAIKVLPDLFADDPERRVRFDREAQLLASLNHPHIAQIYGFHDFPSPGNSRAMLPALVMELVDGPTLAARIARGPLPLDEALPMARQIAEALEAAHERGIIHRDLKPSNIKLTTGGAVKVLDFGLAKALDPAAPPPAPSAASGVVDAAYDPISPNSPTYASPATQAGAVLGTAAYMAPEQVRGKAVDKRADIWAFGVVFYEMLCGGRLFAGETASVTMGAVLHQEVDWTRLPADLPDDLRRLLRRCLERNPTNRLHDAADARLVIADVLREGSSSAGMGTVPRGANARASRSRASWLLAAALAIGTAILGAVIGRTWTTPPPAAAPAQPIVRFTLEPPSDVTHVTNVSVAPDGRFMVYEGYVDGESRLFLHRFDELSSRQLPGTEGARWPFISPDGAWVAFFRESKIYKVSSNGSDALPICDVRGGPGAAFDGAGGIIFSRTWLSGLSMVSADGGTPTVLTTPDRAKREVGHWWPSILPDGRVLFTVITATSGFNDAGVAIFDPKQGTYRIVFQGARASWLSSGHIFFWRAGRYQAVRFDLASSTRIGDPFPVLEDAQEFDPLGDWPQAVSTGSSGALAYLAGPYVPPSRLMWIDAKGTQTPLAFAPRPFVSVRLSPTGKRVATASLEAGRLLIRLFDLERGTDEVPTMDGMNWNPTWLPDGRLSFTSMRKGDFDVYVKDDGGTGAEHAVLIGPDDTDPIAWTRDGRLVFQGSEPDGVYPLKLFDPRQPNRTTRLTDQHSENGGTVSPDDRWLVYQSAATGRSLVYVRPLAGTAPALPLSRNTGDFPVFLRDGKTLALIRGRQVVLVPWKERDGRFEIGPERPVTQLAFGTGWMYGAPYDPGPDGRLLTIVRTQGAPPLRIRVVLGWDRELTRLGTRQSE